MKTNVRIVYTETNVAKVWGLDPFPTFSNHENKINEIISGHASKDLGYLYFPLCINSGFFITLLIRNKYRILTGFNDFQKSPIIGVIIPNPTHHIIQIKGVEKF